MGKRMEEDKQSVTGPEEEQIDVKDEGSEQDRETKESEVPQGDETPGIEEKPSNGVQEGAGATVQSAEASAGGKDDLMEMYEESLKSLQEGELVRGEIVKLDKEFVLVLPAVSTLYL